jgi:hypothetical protein
MQIINIKSHTCYNDIPAEVGSEINQEKLAGEMVGMGRTWSHVWFGKMIYRPERSRGALGAL